MPIAGPTPQALMSRTTGQPIMPWLKLELTQMQTTAEQFHPLAKDQNKLVSQQLIPHLGQLPNQRCYCRQLTLQLG
jgi:hypothetical protein